MTLAGCAFRLYIYFRRGLSRFAFLSSFDENCVSMTLVVVFILATVIIITSTPRFKSIFKIHIKLILKTLRDFKTILVH